MYGDMGKIRISWQMALFTFAMLALGSALTSLSSAYDYPEGLRRSEAVHDAELFAGVCCTIALFAVSCSVLSIKDRHKRHVVLLQIVLGMLVLLTAVGLSLIRYSRGKFSIGEPSNRYFSLELLCVALVLLARAMAPKT